MSSWKYEDKPLLESDDSEYVLTLSGSKTREKPWISTRYIFVLLAFFGLFNVYALRVNLSVAIVAMVDNSAQMRTSAAAEGACPVSNNTTAKHSAAKGEFHWDSSTQAIILSSFFYGYIFTQLPGAWIARRLGPKLPFGISCFVSGLLALFIPLAARWSEWALVAVRVLQGIAQGFCFPSLHTLLGNWAPPLERTKMVTIAYSGMHAGTVGALLISGVLAEYLGWPSIFYFFGGSACVWFILWMFLASDSPESHPRISAKERSYIVATIGQSHDAHGSSDIPWRKFFSSLPLWAIAVGHFGNNWGFYTLLTNLPTYLSTILHFSLKENGAISALPYLIMAFGMVSSGFLADRLRRRHVLSTTHIRRLFHFVGQILPAICLIGVGYIGCDVNAAVTVLALGVGSSSIAAAGYQGNHIDLSPTYSGILMGLTNTLATIPGIVSPYVVGLITSGPSGQTVSKWREVFYIAAGVYAVTALFYLIFASGEPERWEKKEKMDKENASRDSDSITSAQIPG